MSIYIENEELHKDNNFTLDSIYECYIDGIDTHNNNYCSRHFSSKICGGDYLCNNCSIIRYCGITICSKFHKCCHCTKKDREERLRSINRRQDFLAELYMNKLKNPKRLVLTIQSSSKILNKYFIKDSDIEDYNKFKVFLNNSIMHFLEIDAHQQEKNLSNESDIKFILRL